QLMAIFLIRQARSMSLDADVLEAVAARRPRQIREVMAQRHFGTGEGKSLPPAFPGVLGEDPSELIVRLGPQPVHRPFDHAMDALQVALEVHRDFHVIVCRKALAGGGHGERNINIGHETLLPGESPHRDKERERAALQALTPAASFHRPGKTASPARFLGAGSPGIPAPAVVLHSPMAGGRSGKKAGSAASTLEAPRRPPATARARRSAMCPRG